MQGSSGHTISRRRRIAAVLAALLLPAGAGLVVIGYPLRATLWTTGVMLAFSAMLYWPIAAGLLVVSIGVASVADAALTLPLKPPPGGLKTSALVLLFTVVVGAVRFAHGEYVTEPFQVPSNAMAPALLAGDQFMVDARPARVERGDVVVFRTSGGEIRVNRVVGVAGDVVAMSGARLLINAHDIGSPGPPCEALELPEGTTSPCSARNEERGTRAPYVVVHAGDTDAVRFPRPAGGCPGGMEQTADGCVVPAETVFVVGDNRNNSRDSRSYGPVELSAIRGRAITIHFSFSDGRVRWGRIGRRLD